MKFIFVGVFLLAASITGFAQDTAFKIENLGWISGCWQMESKDKNSSVTEHWTKLGGQSMFGVSRTIKAGKTTDYEYLRIVQDEKGIFYIAKPRSNPEETSFKLVKLAGNEATFENPTHDFPQRIIYKLDGTMMSARVEGNNKGKPMGFDLKFAKIGCE